MSPKQLYELIQELKSEVVGINSAWVVVDDSQLGNTLEQKTKEDGAYLIGVLPSYGSVAHSGSIRETTISQLLIVEKTDYSDLSQNEFIDVFERTYQLTKRVKEILVEKVESGCYPQMFHLDLSNLNMSPIWKKSQCNGWVLDWDS
ncbi:hypothetical protein [Bergeyella zoohelcum]|uniref:Uncharacterized protein n=1 Tax=Bergeyella zoohelcum TaxID=1015 RepID=A0A380ZYG7_9FLAO|nr:hypothetical protein [Bergeyella zoohelcum]EKB59069.1 hypothetical protein HMPREF9700_01546 [Bergeyella zoohelcum CCUG 30536]SUV52570.1 Uncharacterised protein [Bergeyella zoohelcum]